MDGRPSFPGSDLWDFDRTSDGRFACATPSAALLFAHSNNRHYNYLAYDVSSYTYVSDRFRDEFVSDPMISGSITFAESMVDTGIRLGHGSTQGWLPPRVTFHGDSWHMIMFIVPFSRDFHNRKYQNDCLGFASACAALGPHIMSSIIEDNNNDSYRPKGAARKEISDLYDRVNREGWGLCTETGRTTPLKIKGLSDVDDKMPGGNRYMREFYGARLMLSQLTESVATDPDLPGYGRDCDPRKGSLLVMLPYVPEPTEHELNQCLSRGAPWYHTSDPCPFHAAYVLFRGDDYILCFEANAGLGKLQRPGTFIYGVNSHCFDNFYDFWRDAFQTTVQKRGSKRKRFDPVLLNIARV